MADYDLDLGSTLNLAKLAKKLPIMSQEKAAAMIDQFIAPMIERAGMTVKVTKTKTTRTLKIQLPAK
jgi:hypothetical protein